jgi:hypothetical protein
MERVLAIESAPKFLEATGFAKENQFALAAEGFREVCFI